MPKEGRQAELASDADESEPDDTFLLPLKEIANHADAYGSSRSKQIVGTYLDIHRRT